LFNQNFDGRLFPKEIFSFGGGLIPVSYATQFRYLHSSSDCEVVPLRNPVVPLPQLEPPVNIEYDYVKLSKSLAIAISYTWGEFDRRDVVVAHDAQGNVVSMNLGVGRDTRETINTLVRLCEENGKEKGEEHAGVWID
jgi:hypothetical protein